MKILCVDTSSDICSVCVMQDEQVCAIKELNNGKTHSENLMPLINEVVDNLNTIDAIACCIGPGSFTGIRIGISAIKAIAEVKQIPVIGVTSLEGLAYNNEFDGMVCSLIDARNNQVYSGIFKEHELLGEYIADDIENVLNAYSNSVVDENTKILFVGNGAVLHKERILQRFGEKAHFSEKNDQTSSSIGKCALRKKKFDNADTVSPLYLRVSQAERMKFNSLTNMQ